MKLEILKKLIALANNNPNDNEANLAARKVCKALIEDKYVDQLKDVVIPAAQTIPPNYKPHPKQEQYYKEPFDFYDFFRRASNSPFNESKWTGPPKNEPPKGTYYNPYTEEYVDKDKRKLKCKTCGKIKETKFRGLAEIFECNDCQWTAFERNKKGPKEEKQYGHICHMTGGKCNTPVTCVGLGCKLRI
jgi:hypothetical protein